MPDDPPPDFDANAEDFLPPELLVSAIVDSSEDAIVSKDLRAIVTSWNKAAERMFGYTREEMIGQPITRLIPPDRLEEETLILKRIHDGERVEHFETVRRRKDGTLVDVSLTISPIRNSEGRIVGASKIARDISAQKRDSARLVAAHDALKRADRLKSDFLATLSHELRTPLNAILGWVQLLKESHNAEDVAQGINVIERNVRLQSQLIEELLDMSRIEAGKVSLDVQRLDLSKVVTAAMEAVRPTAVSKSIRLTSTFASVDGIVMGDKNRLQQIIWNLLVNAIKFTPKEGHVHVVLQRVNSHVEVAVTDSGAGIAPEFLGQVFERFRQADASTTRAHGGLGLGLSIAKNLTELHGGTLAVASAGLGKGATFTVHLPLASVHPTREAQELEQRHAAVDDGLPDGDLQGIRVLVLDDEMDSLQVVELILKRSGAEVCSTRTMDDALAAFADFRPDVVLSDIGMPGHDGYEFISRLRAVSGGRSVPAVALTAMARTEDRTRALRSGFQMHVPKPVDAHELVAVVQNLGALKTPVA
jgi:PAS domain S-box-containing protein